MEIQILVSTLDTPIHKQLKSLIHLLLVNFVTFLEKCSSFDLILELLDRAPAGSTKLIRGLFMQVFG